MNVQTELIPGIYNYCDTWCERCLFTSRCRSFQIQTETGLTKSMEAGPDLINQLTDALNLTKQYIENLSRSGGLTGADAPADTTVQALEENALSRPVQVGQHPVAQLANSYLKHTGDWLRQEKHLLEQAGEQQLREVSLGFRTQEESMPILHALRDAWEIINWYRTLIPVKTQSALRALSESDATMKVYHLGKAKLVLVSIDRSLAAWQTILAQYPDKTDNLLDVLAQLSRLRRELETLFPTARAFQRPGLD